MDYHHGSKAPEVQAGGDPLDQADVIMLEITIWWCNINLLMQCKKNLFITAARKTVIISTHLLTSQNGARGINNNWRKPIRMCLNQQPHSPFMWSVIRFVVVIFSLVPRLNPMVNINVRGMLKYNLMRIALIPFTGPWQIKQGPFPTFPITSILKSLRHFSSHRHQYL